MLMTQLKGVCDRLRGTPFLWAVLCGCLYTLGFAPFNLWPLALLALWGVASMAFQLQGFWRVVLFVFVFAFCHYLTALNWLIGSFLAMYDPLWLAWLLGVVCVVALSAFLAAFMALFLAPAVRLLQGRGVLVQGLFFASFWVAFEAMRSFLVPTFAWNLPVHVWAGNPEFLQALPHVGLFGLSFIFVLSAVWLRCPVGRVFSVLLLVGVYLNGLAVLSNAPDGLTEKDKKGLSVQVVSGYVPQKEKWQKQAKWSYLNDYLERSSQPEEVDLLIWPETAVTYYVERDDALRDYLRQKTTAEAFVFGAPSYRLGGYYNSLYKMDEDGQLSFRYDKRYLVPFGEYFPFQNWMPAFLKRFLQGQSSYSSGQADQQGLMVKGVVFAPLICGEIVLPFAADLVDGDADYVLNITNDAWFRGFWGPAQHFAIVKVQAALLQKTVLRVAHGGTSALIDAYGRVLWQLVDGEQGVLSL